MKAGGGKNEAGSNFYFIITENYNKTTFKNRITVMLSFFTILIASSFLLPASNFLNYKFLSCYDVICLNLFR